MKLAPNDTDVYMQQERKCDTCGMWLDPRTGAHGLAFGHPCHGQVISTTTRHVLVYRIPGKTGRYGVRVISRTLAESLRAYTGMTLYTFD